MKRWPMVIAVVMLLSTWGVLQSRSQVEAVQKRDLFAEFPLSIGDRWQGRELGIEERVLGVLKLTDYMMRLYVPIPRMNGAEREDRTPVWLYVGYYQSQRTGATYHSPKNCLPGAGWQIVESKQMAVSVPGSIGPITINNVLIQKGLDKQVILYWYQDRGRIVPSEYWAKGYMVWDAMTRNRTDGALVRISVPVEQSTEKAVAQGIEFLQAIFPLLGRHLPV